MKYRNVISNLCFDYYVSATIDFSTLALSDRKYMKIDGVFFGSKINMNNSTRINISIDLLKIQTHYSFISKCNIRTKNS